MHLIVENLLIQAVKNYFRYFCKGCLVVATKLYAQERYINK